MSSILAEYADFLVSCLACAVSMFVGCLMGVGLRKESDKLDKEREEERKRVEKIIRLTLINLN